MSREPETHVDDEMLEQTRKRISKLVDEIARLSESQLGSGEYFAEFLPRVLTAIAAPAGAIWGRTPQGHLQLLFEVNFKEIARQLEAVEGGRESHDELLRTAAQQGRARMVAPHSGSPPVNGNPGPGNQTGFVVHLVPIMLDKQVAGLIEIWQDPNRSPDAQRGFLRFLTEIASYPSGFLRNTHLRQMVGQQQLWTQLETYARQIHGSLNTREVAYLVVNEGRRLIDCDRVSLAVRQGSWTAIEAISGADVVEKRSNLVQLMRTLCDEVITWGERLIYAGSKDDSLPPKVLEALDQYLAESNSKVLILAPLKDDRDKDSKRPCRSAMLVECFEPNVTPDQLIARMDVVVKHAAPAVYNAVEYRRLPFRWLLVPLANIKDSFRGKKAAIGGAVAAALLLLTAVLVFTPYTLRMDANGQLLPKERQIVYPQVAGRIVEVKRSNGDHVNKGDEILFIEDLELQQKIDKARSRSEAAQRFIDLYNERLSQPNITDEERTTVKLQQIQQNFEFQSASRELQVLMDQARNPRRAAVLSPLTGTVVTFNTNERLLDRTVKPGEPLLQVARLDGPWEYEVRIPEGHVGHIREALARANGEPLPVDILLSSRPDRTYMGKLYRDGLGGEVTMHNNEPVLVARVEIDDPDLLKELDRMPVGAELKAKIHCGKRSMGYVWFYELWEFFYEHVVF